MRVTIFCASVLPADEAMTEQARRLGTLLAQAGIETVTGGGVRGFMGVFADSVLAAGGRIVGVIPEFMVERGWHHPGLSEMRVVQTLQERKLLMAEMSDAVITYPGGVGTLDELCEFLAMHKLGLWNGRIVLYNYRGFYDGMIDMLRRTIEDGFTGATLSDLVTVVDTPEDAIAALSAAK